MSLFRTFDKCCLGLLLALSLLVAGFPYLAGRLRIFPPLLVLACTTLIILAVAAAFLARSLASSFAGKRLPQFVLRLGLLGAIDVTALLPSFLHLDLFKRGREDNIRAVFTDDVVAQLRTIARTALTSSGQSSLDLSINQLPAAVKHGSWGLPKLAFADTDPDTGSITVLLTWGGALIGHHGIVLSDTPIPATGYPQHFMDAAGNDIAISTKTFKPWKNNSCIMYDTE